MTGIFELQILREDDHPFLTLKGRPLRSLRFLKPNKRRRRGDDLSGAVIERVHCYSSLPWPLPFITLLQQFCGASSTPYGSSL